MNLFRVTILMRESREKVEFFVTHEGDSLVATEECVRPLLATLGIDEPSLKQIRVAIIPTSELGVSA